MVYNVFFDQHVYPMEPRRSQEIPGGESYSYQVKWDGMRILAFGRRGELRLQGKKLSDKTKKYPELNVLLQLVKADEFILDGEIIALLNGRPSFYNLMRRENAGFLKSREIPVFYMVFDILYFGGEWLVKKSWESRQEILAGALERHELVNICNNFDDGASLMDVVEKKQLEGMVAKQKKSPYVNGPRKSPHWLKIKLEQSIDAQVGGVMLKNGKAASLLLGLQDDINEKEGIPPGTLRYIGSISSGFTQQELAAWKDWSLKHSVSQSFFRTSVSTPGQVLWVEPVRSISVVFNEWTPDLKLRAPRVKKN